MGTCHRIARMARINPLLPPKAAGAPACSRLWMCLLVIRLGILDLARRRGGLSRSQTGAPAAPGRSGPAMACGNHEVIENCRRMAFGQLDPRFQAPWAEKVSLVRTDTSTAFNIIGIKRAKVGVSSSIQNHSSTTSIGEKTIFVKPS